jgi:rhodanese-related sulfurtransferase
MPVAALRHYWNGEAIVVGSAGEAAEVASMSRWTWRVQVALVALGLITTAAMWRRARRLQRQAVSWPATAGQLAMLLAVAAGFGFAAKFVYAGRQIALETSARHDADVVLVNFDDPKVPVSQTTAHNISAAEFRAKLGEGAMVLDVRGDEHYRPLHVAGAVSVPDLNEKAMRLRLAGVPKDRLILVYCADIKCPRGRVACGVLERLGFTNVLYYPEGWADLKTWTDLRFEKGEGTAP